jgi:nucleoside-diphosphate-sugar epimerase
VYTDADWTVPDSKQFPISTYYRSKLEAERAAWAFVEGLPNDHKFELATVNPSLVQGPLLSGAKSCTSADIIKQVHTDIALRDSSLFLVSCRFLTLSRRPSLAPPLLSHPLSSAADG